MEKKAKNKAEKPAKEGGGFLQSILDAIFKSNSPDAEKKRKLKAIAKDFSKTRFHSYFKPSSCEMMPPYAKLFYNVYKLVAPAQNYLRGIQNKNAFKMQCINYSLTENQLTLLEHLSEEKINEMATKVPLSSIKEKINSDLETFTREFDGERAARVENLHKAYLAFNDFCTFDYYYMLKKFAPSLQEQNFTAVPTFEKANAEYLLEDIQDLITIIYSIPEDILWDAFFAMIKETRGGELMSAGNWKKILSQMKSLQASRSLEMMVKLINKNPKFEPTIEDAPEPIVDTYLEKIREEALNAVAAVESRQKANRANDFCEKIFGKTEIDQLKNYTAEFNNTLSKKELALYEYPEALNYLKEFLIEYVKTDLREYSDIVVIRGQWDAKLSAPFSNGYQNLLAVSDKITAFDEMLAEDGAVGIKIKTLLPKIAHDPGAENIINRLVSDANESAKEFIVASIQDLITIAKLIKQLLEDEQKKKPLLVQNWRDLEKFSERPLMEFGVDLYKRIYLFVQLMQTCLENQA